MNTGAPDDLDLDNVLDNYLTQLGQNDAGAAAMAGMMPDGLAGLGGAGMGGMSGMMGMQGGMPAGLLNPAALYGGLPPNMLGMQQAAAMQTQPNMAAAAAAGGSAGGSGRATSNKKGATRGRKASEKVASRAAAAAAADDDSDAGGSSDGSASSSEQKSRKKREVSGDDDLTAAEKRHLALQEKNRRAQRRFRERQKVRFVLNDGFTRGAQGRRRDWHEAAVTAPAAPSQLRFLWGPRLLSSCCLEHWPTTPLTLTFLSHTFASLHPFLLI